MWDVAARHAPGALIKTVNYEQSFCYLLIELFVSKIQSLLRSYSCKQMWFLQQEHYMLTHAQHAGLLSLKKIGRRTVVLKHSRLLEDLVSMHTF